MRPRHPRPGRLPRADGLGVFRGAAAFRDFSAGVAPSPRSRADLEEFAVRPRTTPMNSSIHSASLSARQASATVLGGASTTGR